MSEQRHPFPRRGRVQSGPLHHSPYRHPPPRPPPYPHLVQQPFLGMPASDASPHPPYPDGRGGYTQYQPRYGNPSKRKQPHQDSGYRGRGRGGRATCKISREYSAEYDYEQYSVKMFENPWEYLLTPEQEEAHLQQIAKKFQKDSETGSAEVGVAGTGGLPDDSKINIDSDDDSVSDNNSEELMEQETGSSSVKDLSQESCNTAKISSDSKQDLCTSQGTESESQEI